MDRSRQTKRAIVVTGGASGIGLAVTSALVESDCTVAVLDSNLESLERLEGAFGTDVLGIRCDVSDETSVIASVAFAERRLGRLSGLVTSAGVELSGEDAAVDKLEMSVWERTLAVNVTGTFLACKHMVPALRRAGGGSVVLIGSPTGLRGFAVEEHAYSASKSAVHGLGSVMATTYAPEGIRVNVVVPGFVRTPLNEQLLRNPERLAALQARIPLGRAAEPAEVASAVVYVLSPSASFMTGSLMVVDGGQTTW